MVLSACTPSGETAARAAGDRFQAALRENDSNAACQLLSDEARGNLEPAAGRPCPAALMSLDLPPGSVRSVEVWGDNALVRLEAGVLFLARFQAGWKVTGAGCVPRAEMPYDCDVEG